MSRERKGVRRAGRGPYGEGRRRVVQGKGRGWVGGGEEGGVRD